MSETTKTDSITDDEVFEKFILTLPAIKRKEKPVLNQKDINKFQRVWDNEFISYRGRYRKKHRDTKKENEYKNCLFTIYFYHWDKIDGFQINMESVGERIGKSAVTVDRMILLFVKSRILVFCN
jgi:hypothetical protein